jgi:methanogen homocitrate synthase
MPWVVPGSWSVSPHNFEPAVRKDWQAPETITVHDVTLRDGEQWPGVVFRKEERLRIAHALADLGVHRIEGGMPSISEDDAEALLVMCREIKTAEISSFARARREDVELAAKCGVQRVIMEIPMLPGEIIRIWGGVERAAEAYIAETDFAAQNGLKVTLFLMEASRAPAGLLRDLVAPIAAHGKIDSVGLVDTRGSALPQAMAWLVGLMRSIVRVPIEVHAHNTWGVATATTLSAITAGAEVIHVAVNGLNGNAALEECVMGVHALVGIDTGIRTRGLLALSKLVREASGTDWYKAFVGDGLARVEIGLPARGMWERRQEAGYGRSEFLNYEVVGGTAVDLVLGKKSGVYSVVIKAWELSLPIPGNEAVQQILSGVKAISLREKRLVSDDEFRALHQSAIAAWPGEPMT